MSDNCYSCSHCKYKCEGRDEFYYCDINNLPLTDSRFKIEYERLKLMNFRDSCCPKRKD